MNKKGGHLNQYARRSQKVRGNQWNHSQAAYQKRHKKASNQATKLFIGGLPPTCTE